MRPCNCVFRAIFRACLTRFSECIVREKYISRVTLDSMTGKDSSGAWGRKHEEFVADFCLVSRRTLDDLEYKIFRYHFLLGAGWKLCCRKLKMERGNFFHAVYRIEQKLGKIFAELEPYALFPIDEYFDSYGKVAVSIRPGTTSNVIPIRPPVGRKPIDFPIEKSA